MDRRRFLRELSYWTASGAASFLSLGLVSRFMKRDPAGYGAPGEPGILRPPGALDEPAFLAACIRCQRCQDVCPSGCIRLAGPGEPAHPGTPYILADRAACTLCLDCTRACPTHALTPLSEMTEVAMGVAVVDERTCVSINRSGICGACHTACPLKNRAIKLGLHNSPEVIASECVGCGLCEEACILEGIKAIRVFSGRGGSIPARGGRGVA